MIKFFRKIRQKLLSDGKLSKYLFYAIGEIVLVVIGILIALQINNWNEHQKNREKEKIYLIEVKKNLESDLQNEIKPAINFLSERVKMDNILRENFFTIENPTISHDSINKLIIDFAKEWDLVLNTTGYSNIMSIGMDIITNNSIRNDISNLYNYEYKFVTIAENECAKYKVERFAPLLEEFFGLPEFMPTHELKKLDVVFRTQQSVFAKSRYIKQRIYTLKNVKPKVEQLIMNIEVEIENLQN